ncbi:Rha family transcriptional regulator [Turicimonas muris]|uniref:Rha family transcriptional regulator n=1 Tax=Turicimonas muris TaxID=1796652 RepID=UPI0026E0B48C|nr:Rha family transcriptional regulator [Turicimonas muris]
MQENPSNGTSVPVLSIVKNQVTALSTDVAQFFNKVHKNVIRDIENLLVNLPSARRLNFELCFEYSELQNGKALKRYRMTRDGFTLLVMGWTGEKALQFKLAWLDAFNKMEEELRAKNTVQALPLSSPLGKSIAPAINAAPMLHGQLQCVQLAMKDRFTNQRDLLRAYSILQHHFCVTSYRQIPAARFDELMDYIKSMEMKPLRVKKSNAFLATSDNDLVSRFGITIINGEPKIYELGDAWHLVRVGSYEWIKAYCENRLPANQVPDLLKALLHRLNKETL